MIENQHGEINICVVNWQGEKHICRLVLLTPTIDSFKNFKLFLFHVRIYIKILILAFLKKCDNINKSLTSHYETSTRLIDNCRNYAIAISLTRCIIDYSHFQSAIKVEIQ